MRLIVFAAAVIFGGMRTATTAVKYTPYQIATWYIQSEEGFTSYWKRDGYVAGRKAYVIGMGYNDWGKPSRRYAISEPLRGGLSYDEALTISLEELKSYRTGKTNVYVDLAFRLHIFNTGKCSSIEDLRGCCGKRIGCGSASENVRTAHNPRRKFEYALATHNWDYVNFCIETYKEKASALRRKHN
jgi:hypothetical protein